MHFLPFDKMNSRLDIARDSSDTDVFFTLLYFGEMVTKLVTAGLVAAIDNDRERSRYRQVYRLVRADGLGDWCQAINDILTGPSAQHLVAQAMQERQELTQRVQEDKWQYQAVSLLHKCLDNLNVPVEDLPTKLDGRRWFDLFATLRNKTRGHGAPPSDICSHICGDLGKSIQLVIENIYLFKRPWAYLYRNISGKYRVTKWVEDATAFEPLKTFRIGAPPELPNGVYIDFGLNEPMPVDLVCSTQDALDFYLANGGFNGKRYELISYITGETLEADASPYLTPITELPCSETQGTEALNVQGNCFGNLPPVQSDYIRRTELETELYKRLMDDHHSIITLVGRGGIGKTWLALSVLHQISNKDRFTALLWFSARDIDLLPNGPKMVTPHVLSEGDIANEFARLMSSLETRDKQLKPQEYFAQTLQKSGVGSLLFVFDNFETVRSPIDLYTWIDMYIRPPNKVLITTRIREFKGDYPVEVSGMTESESYELINTHAGILGIKDLITDAYRHELYTESEGHPYVIKVLLGQVAQAGAPAKVERIVASREEILDALFERTYARLSSEARRVFLTLCSWRSTLPVLSLEAVLLQPTNDRMDVLGAIDELSRSSFVEVVRSKEDDELFVSVPLVASVFGKRKLSVSKLKSAIEADTRLLYAFGAAQQADVARGVGPRIDRLFSYIAQRLNSPGEELSKYLPILEFIADKYPKAWLKMASLYEETVPGSEGKEAAKAALMRCLERAQPTEDIRNVWNRLAYLCADTTDWVGEIHAMVEMCLLPDTPFWEISNAANRLNSLFRIQTLDLDTDEKQVLVRKLVSVMNDRINEASATDCSRMAWLALQLHDENLARYCVNEGLHREPENDHCLKLATKLATVHG